MLVNSTNNFMHGKEVAQTILNSLNIQIKNLPNKPCLAVILVGDDKASKLYISLKEKKAKEIGVKFQKFLLPANASEKKIIDLIKKLNTNKKITGIMLQLPLPKKFNANKIISFIARKKDVDGLRPPLLTKERAGVRSLAVIPPTIQSILRLIKLSRQKLTNKNAVILCNSLEFAEPLKLLLEKKKIKVRIILKPNPKLLITYYLLPFADIIISALGKKHFIKPNMIKKNAVVIDVGITRQNKKTFGDVDPECFKKSKYISPVPGGVGPLTVAYLMKNLFELAKNKK
jgi:methylenetetrahydrofolate dehydrogenase (NADP+)/methenyltetrahydrofolate cyclohydrolase